MSKKKSASESDKKPAKKAAPATKKSAASAKTAAPAKKAAAKPAPKKQPARAKKETKVEVVASEAVVVLGEGEALNRVVDAAAAGLVAAPPIETAPELTDEERELSAIYGEDVSGAPARAHGEFQDAKTRDEDRPMVPEINAREERKAQWQDRRDRRKQRRDDRQQTRDGRPQGGNGGGGQSQGGPGGGRPHEQQRLFNQGGQGGQNGQGGQAQPHSNPNNNGANSGASNGATGAANGGQSRESRPNLQMPIPVTGEHDVLARVGTPLGDAAAAVFAQLRNGQPLPDEIFANRSDKGDEANPSYGP